MTSYQFLQLPDDKKYDAVWQQGFRVAGRTFGGHRIILYQLDSFYVEVFFNQISSCIVNFYCFSNTDFLEPYLVDIDLDYLLS